MKDESKTVPGGCKNESAIDRCLFLCYTLCHRIVTTEKPTKIDKKSTSLRINGYADLKKKYDEMAGKVNYDVMDIVKPRVQVFNETAVLYYRLLSTTLNPDGTIK
jgi:hypothetical protein